MADLDALLGYKGNYMIFPVKQAGHIHWRMMRDYVDPAAGALRDSDAFSRMSTDDLLAEVCYLKETDPARFERERPEILRLLKEKMSASRSESDWVIVPSGSIISKPFLESIPLLEDFKLFHRVLDVKKVQSEIRGAEIENLRRAARLLESEREDPYIHKSLDALDR